ncbi:hypothetical protein Hanom_Chr06g00503271 [Helianthus anomalus]
MPPRVRTRHGEVIAELAWSGSGSRSEITPAVGKTVQYPPYYNHTKPTFSSLLELRNQAS